MMIGVYNHLLSKVFRLHYHSQKVIGSLGILGIPEILGDIMWNPNSRLGNTYTRSPDQMQKKYLLVAYTKIMAGQPTPPNVPPPEIAGLIKGLLTIGFP